MPLSPGERLGPYEIVAAIGAGGMGEVYRARDTRLERVVAVKVMPAEFARDAQRRNRFETEAKAVAALNHPNIVALHDIGEADGVVFTVSELIDGETLRGQTFPLRKAMDIAAQIADGLAAAHASGVTHRDLKPDNIMLTRDGRAKILDFGLAQTSARNPDATLTAAGTVMGTAGYMSPEQVRGESVDARSDIFSFGAVVYEMLAERRAFDAETAVEAMNAILKSEPPELAETVPPMVRDIVRRCLEKQREQRFQSANDLAFALRHHTAASTRETPAVKTAGGRWRWPVAIAATALVSVFAGIVIADRPRLDMSELKITPMSGDVESASGPAWAPDGKSFVFSAGGVVMSRSMDAEVAVPISQERRGWTTTSPLFSVDGKRLLFTVPGVENRTIWSLSLVSGAIEQLVREPINGFPYVDGIAEAPDGSGILAAHLEPSGSYSLNSYAPPEYAPRKLPYPEFQSTDRIRLRFSPDGRRLLIGTQWRNDTLLYVVPWPPRADIKRFAIPNTGRGEAGSFSAEWMSDGRHIVLRGDKSGIFDLESERFTGLGDGFRYSIGGSLAGRYLASSRDVVQVPITLPLDGSAPAELSLGKQGGLQPVWNLDGSKLAYVAGNSLWLWDPKSGQKRVVVTGVASPKFSPDGRRIAYSSGRAIHVVAAEGGRPTPVTEGNRPVWSPDGKTLAFLEREGAKWHLSKISLDGQSKPERVIETATGMPPAWSPDGRMLAFVAANSKGADLLHVRPLDSLTARELPGTDGAWRPFWSPDGKSLGFAAGGKLKRIDLAGGTPITLCDARNARGGTWNKDGVILFGDQTSLLQRISASGGTPAPATQLNIKDGESAHYYPQFLPGGKRFLYLVRGADSQKAGVVVGSLDGGPPVQILQSNYKAEYEAVSGRLFYLQGGATLLARSMELDPPRLVGDPMVIAEDIRAMAFNGFAEFSVAGGSVAYGRGGSGSWKRFVWRDRSGKILATVGEAAQIGTSSFFLSNDETRIAHTLMSGQGALDVWVMDMARGVSTRLSFSGGSRSVWSPDGKSVYYATPGGIRRKASDGTGEEALVSTANASTLPNDVSPDGKYLLYYAATGDILIQPLTGEAKPEPYLNAPRTEEAFAKFSPDGRWVAYASDETGRREIYVQGFPDKRGKWLVSSAGGAQPAWRADGKELYWVTPGGEVWAASMELQAAAVKPGKPEMLFRIPAVGAYPQALPSRDGKKFLTLEPEGGEKELPLVVLLNWAARR